MNSHVVVVDDDRDYLEILGKKLAAIGIERVYLEESSVNLSRKVKSGLVFDLALINMTLSDIDGVTLLETIKANSPSTECIMVASINEARIAVECLKKGAYDYLVKPVSIEDLDLSIKRTLEHKRLLELLELEKRDDLPTLENDEHFQAIITSSRKMRRILKEAELHAAVPVPLLITGECGTGKKMLARAIHRASPLAGYPFITIDMASLANCHFESEIFGSPECIENGSTVHLKATDKGTVLFDQIGDLPAPYQGKLLRILKKSALAKQRPIVDQKPQVRFIATTSENLEQPISRKQFRKDLYYSIRGGWLHLPPLRERSGDTILLVRTLLKKYYGDSLEGAIDKPALEMLMRYSYPGNIRELKSILQSAAFLARGKPIQRDHLPVYVKAALKADADEVTMIPVSPIKPLAEIEKAHILDAYRQTGENKSKTARYLGIGLNTLRRKLATYDVL